MPYTMYKRLQNVTELIPTRMTLQLADPSIVYSKRILFYMALRIGKLVVPCDFVIMDIPEDVNTPIILRRLCLATTSTLINVARGKLVMNVGVEKVEFAIRDVLSALVPNESIYEIDIIDVVRGKLVMDVFMDDFSVYGNSFDDCLANLEEEFVRCEEVNLVLNWEKCHFMEQ